MKKVKAEMWDKVQYIFRNYYDRMVHCYLEYDSKLDAVALKKAFEKLVNEVEILHCVFSPNPINPYWKVSENYSIDDYFKVVEVEEKHSVEVAESIIMQTIPLKEKVQIKLTVIRSEKKDILTLVYNHMCMDGGDGKKFLVLLLETYNAIVNNTPMPLVKTGDRGYRQVYATMDEEKRTAAKKLFINASRTGIKVQFPFTKDKDCTNKLIRKTLDAQTIGEIKARGKTLGASLNDLFATAYLRAIAEMCKLDESSPINIINMADLRRHIEGNDTKGFTNLTGFMLCVLQDGVGKDFNETLTKVIAQTAKAKEDKFLGLSGLPLLNLAFTIFPYCISELAIRIGYTNPLLGMSNVGIIDAEKLTASGCVLTDAFITGATKYKPYFQVACTTLNNAITFSVVEKCSAQDEKIIRKFINLFFQNLFKFIE